LSPCGIGLFFTGTFSMGGRSSFGFGGAIHMGTAPAMACGDAAGTTGMIPGMVTIAPGCSGAGSITALPASCLCGK